METCKQCLSLCLNAPPNSCWTEASYCSSHPKFLTFLEMLNSWALSFLPPAHQVCPHLLTQGLAGLSFIIEALTQVPPPVKPPLLRGNKAACSRPRVSLRGAAFLVIIFSCFRQELVSAGGRKGVAACENPGIRSLENTKCEALSWRRGFGSFQLRVSSSSRDVIGTFWGAVLSRERRGENLCSVPA